MAKHTNIHKIYSVLTAISAVIAGICLMIACVGIWGAGDAPFTPASVEAAFTPISVPVYLCLILVLGGLVLDAVCPLEAQKLRAGRQPAVVLKKLSQKVDFDHCGPTLAQDIRQLQQRLSRISGLKIGVLALLAALFLGYALNPGHFVTEDPTGSVIQAMYILLPCLAAALAVSLVLHKLQLQRTEALIELIKQAPPRKDAVPSPASVKKNWIPALQAVLIVAALVMIAYGASAGGTTDVLAKAVNICTECVGLG